MSNDLVGLLILLRIYIIIYYFYLLPYINILKRNSRLPNQVYDFLIVFFSHDLHDNIKYNFSISILHYIFDKYKNQMLFHYSNYEYNNIFSLKMVNHLIFIFIFLPVCLIFIWQEFSFHLSLVSLQFFLLKWYYSKNIFFIKLVAKFQNLILEIILLYFCAIYFQVKVHSNLLKVKVNLEKL